MRKFGVIMVLGLCFSLVFSSGVLADGHGGWYGGGHGRWHGGWYGGVYWGWYGPWYPYAYPYYYPYAYPYPYPYPSPDDPPAAVPVPSQGQQSYWYYCRDSNAYYPYVTSCPSAWVPVAPTPPSSTREGTAQ